MTGPRDAAPDGQDFRVLDPPQRVSGMRVLAGWTLPGKPPDLTSTAEDAWRQTGFLLGADLRLITANLDLQARLAATGAAPTARTMTMAGFASLWSRAFLSTSDAAGLVRRGGYQSALPLIRQAVEHIAAQAQLGDDLDTYRAWTHTAYGRHAATRSEEIGLGHFFGGEAIARDPVLRLIYRAASDLGRPNFGPTALFVAGEGSHARYPLIFADEAFHVGWAQLLLGWLLEAGARQLHLALHLPQHFPATPELRQEAAGHVRELEAHLADESRCRLEEAEDEAGRRRHLLTGFRRQPGDAPRRLLL